jgi:tRNA pseudouridine38-40 synthase
VTESVTATDTATVDAGASMPRRDGAQRGAAPDASLELRRVAFGVSYDGSGFHGFAAQPGTRTVAGALVTALRRSVGSEVVLTCAGRTDTGVHARCQVVHADLPAAALVRYEQLARRGRLLAPEEPPLGPATAGDAATGARRPAPGTAATAAARELPTVFPVPSDGSVPSGASVPFGPELPGLCRSLSQQLSPEIAVWRAVVVPDAFDARHAATFRRYRYDIETSSRLDPSYAHAAWHVGRPLDLSAMRLGTDPLIGEHDFAAFSRRVKGSPPGPIKRRVHDARWLVLDDGHLRFEIEAKAFAHQMVRSLVGALVAVGEGRARPSDIVALLRAGDRQGAPRPAPARGLALVAVGYPAELGGAWT